MPAKTPQRIIVLIPTRGSIVAELAGALLNNTPGFDIVLRTQNRLAIDESRNHLAEAALAAAADPTLFEEGSDPYIFWIDSDAFFLKGTLTLMIDTLEKNPAIDVLAGLFGPRASNRGATAFRNFEDPKSYLIADVNFKRGDLVEVETVGLHFILHRSSLLKAMGPAPFGSAEEAISDDAAFFSRIRFGNGRVTVATGIPVFHVDERNGTAYTPGIGPCKIVNDAINPSELAEELPPDDRTYGNRIDKAVREAQSHVIPSLSRDSTSRDYRGGSTSSP